MSVSVITFIAGKRGRACVVSGATDGRVRFFDMNGTLIWPELDGIKPDYAVHDGSVTQLAASNSKSHWDGSLVVSAGEDGRLVIWEVRRMSSYFAAYSVRVRVCMPPLFSVCGLLAPWVPLFSLCFLVTIPQEGEWIARGGKWKLKGRLISQMN